MTFIQLYNVSFTTNVIIQIRDDHIAHLTTKTIVVYNSFISNFSFYGSIFNFGVEEPK